MRADDWGRVPGVVKGLHAAGRTVEHVYTAAPAEEVDALADEHLSSYDRIGWASLSPTQKLDLIATAILRADRAVRTARSGERAAEDDDYLSAWQHYDRSRRELLLASLDFFPRASERREWRWHEGGWYGDAPRVIQEHWPKMYDGVVRDGPGFVGVFWSPHHRKPPLGRAA